MGKNHKDDRRQVTMWQSDYACPVCGTLMNTDGNNFYCPNRFCKELEKERKHNKKKWWEK